MEYSLFLLSAVSARGSYPSRVVTKDDKGLYFHQRCHDMSQSLSRSCRVLALSLSFNLLERTTLPLVRCLFSRPELLGSPSSLDTPKTPSVQEIGPENGADMGEVDVSSPTESPDSGSATGVPVSMVVRAVRTLSSPPFLQRVGDSEALRGGRRDADDKRPLRLQLAAISALRELLSSKGGEYVMRATAAMTAAGREVDSKTQEVEEEACESDTGESLQVSSFPL